jgi:hypothetical protein
LISPFWASKCGFQGFCGVFAFVFSFVWVEFVAAGGFELFFG